MRGWARPRSRSSNRCRARWNGASLNVRNADYGHTRRSPAHHDQAHRAAGRLRRGVCGARHQSEPSYRPIVIVDDASLAQVAAITARRLDFELPDVVVEEVPTRRYPGEGIAAHLFGYVGEVNDTMVAEDDTLKSGDLVGQAGIEKI